MVSFSPYISSWDNMGNSTKMIMHCNSPWWTWAKVLNLKFTQNWNMNPWLLMFWVIVHVNALWSFFDFFRNKTDVGHPSFTASVSFSFGLILDLATKRHSVWFIQRILVNNKCQSHQISRNFFLLKAAKT